KWRRSTMKTSGMDSSIEKRSPGAGTGKSPVGRKVAEVKPCSSAVLIARDEKLKLYSMFMGIPLQRLRNVEITFSLVCGCPPNVACALTSQARVAINSEVGEAACG